MGQSLPLHKKSGAGAKNQGDDFIEFFLCPCLKLWSFVFYTLDVIHLHSVLTVRINTDCEGVCYRIYAQQKFQIMPERKGIIKEFLSYYYYKDRPMWFQEIFLYFYEVTQTRTAPYCFECMIALVKADDFTTNIQSNNSKQHFRFSAGGYRMFYSPLILCAQTGFCSLRTSGLHNTYYVCDFFQTHN